jgi:hypothetical protein
MKKIPNDSQIVFPEWYIDFQMEILHNIPRPQEINEQIVSRWICNQSTKEKQLKDALSNAINDTPENFCEIENFTKSKFILLWQKNILIPKNYVHSTQITFFSSKHKNKFEFKKSLRDKDFTKTSHKLIPGKKYTFKIFMPIISGHTHYSHSDVMKFFKSQKVFPIGAQGLTFIWPSLKKNFPNGITLAAFDDKNCCGYSDANVPCAWKRPGEDIWYFSAAGDKYPFNRRYYPIGASME